jgi:DegV family protein with EDD domain
MLVSSQVTVVTDSIANIPKEMTEKHKIIVVPIVLFVQGNLYRDGEDITPSKAYKLFLQDPESFKSSPASAGQYLEAFRKASNQANSILCVTLSSKLSTGYQMASLAKVQAKTEMPQASIEVLDSETATVAEGLIALAAAQTAEEGKELAEVMKEAKKVKDRVNFLILLDTIKHVYRTGRIPKIASQMGSLFHIKPILTSSSGLIKFKGMVRNREKGIDHLLKILRDRVGESLVHIAVTHAYVEDEAQKLKERIASEFNCAELFITEFSPVMGYATGPGTLGFAYYKD